MSQEAAQTFYEALDNASGFIASSRELYWQGDPDGAAADADAAMVELARALELHEEVLHFERMYDAPAHDREEGER